MIELVLGPMFSGKTEYILSRASQHAAIGYKILGIKPRLDDRDGTLIKSRMGPELESVLADTWEDVEAHLFDAACQVGSPQYQNSKTFVVMDEAQFMPATTKNGVPAGAFLWDLRKRCRYDVKFVVAGLMFSTSFEPFPPMQSLIMFSDKITHLKALCKLCGYEAAFTICNQVKTEQVLVGSDMYEPRCGRCYPKGNPNWEDRKVMGTP